MTRIVDSDGSIHAWSYNYRYLARCSKGKLRKCIEVAKCLYSSAQNFRASSNSAKPASCSKNIQCFVGIIDGAKLAPLKCALEQQNTHICDIFPSDCRNQCLAAKWLRFCLARRRFCRKLQLERDSDNSLMYRPKVYRIIAQTRGIRIILSGPFIFAAYFANSGSDVQNGMYFCISPSLIFKFCISEILTLQICREFQQLSKSILEIKQGVKRRIG